jgi:glycyl-tRNA synthetase beta chain
MAINFLLEIGTEELPAHSVLPAAEFIANELKKILTDKDIRFKEVQHLGTPRRLVVLIKQLEEKEPVKKEIVWGPPKNITFDSEGKPTKALEGFLRKNNASLEDVKILKKGKGEYVAIEKEVGGTLTTEILKETIPDILDRIPFPKRMRWYSGAKTFLRPVRWILALANEDIVPLEWANLVASNRTYGHRFINNDGNLRGKPLRVKDINDYFKLLREHFVILDHTEREKLIRETLENYEGEFNAKVPLKDVLVEENTFLVEYVHPILGEFSEKYLELPPLVIITVAAHHQRFFCFQRENGEVVNKFLAISNNVPESDEVVKEGFEKVLRARLEDALFFYREDLKTPLAKRVPKLKDVLQHPKLGTLYDKTLRLIEISRELSEKLFPEKVRKAERAAFLSKADLLTEMVKELDELQGYMGYIYAKEQGEDEEVALALWEQYKPKSAGDEIPKTDVGTVLSIADKLHDLVGYFGIGEKPRSTADPYGLRRAALGIIRILEQNRLNIDLEELTEFTYDQFEDLELSKQALLRELDEFIKQRLVNYLVQKYDPRLVQAVAETKSGFDIVDIIRTVEKLNNLLEDTRLREVREAYRRVGKIIAKVKETHNVKEDLLQQPEEKELYRELVRLEEVFENLPLEEQINKLAELKKVIDRFFDNVMVMVKEEKVKKNRIGLLQRVKKLFERIANFEKLPIKED